MLITFEGIDGSGKTTQAKRLFEYIKDKGLPAYLFREPGGTDLAEKLRDILLSSRLNERSELLLFEASRADLVSERLKPILEKGGFVILDRFTDSTLAYQGYGRGLDIDLIRKLNDFVTQGINPDLTFLLDIEPELAIKRATKRTHFEDTTFLTRVREGFLQIARDEPERVIVLDASASEEEVFQSIIDTLEERGCF